MHKVNKMSNPKDTRKCIACREHCDKNDMLRFVKTKDGDVFLDRSKKADGRGVWLHDNAQCRAKCLKKRLLNVAFKTSVGDEVYGEIND